MFRYLIVPIVSLFFVSACERSIVNRGYDIESVDFSCVKAGYDTPASVARKIGTPTFRSSVLHPNGEYRWYYYAEFATKLGFTKPKTERSECYIITFNSGNVVKSIEKKVIKKTIIRNKDTISTRLGKTKGMLKEVFGGAGKYLDKYSKIKR